MEILRITDSSGIRSNNNLTGKQGLWRDLGMREDVEYIFYGFL